MSINKKIAESLDMEVPKEDKVDGALVEVAPHELAPTIDNVDLPDMTDINRSQIEAEKQLEKVISMSLTSAEEIEDVRSDVEPKYAARYIETGNERMRVALDAIKTKIDTQHKKKELRLKEAGFTGKPSIGTQNNTFFVGSREDLRKLMADNTPGTEDVHDFTDEQDSGSQ